MATRSIELADRQILNILQSRFPLTERPFQAMADEVGVPEDEVIERIALLKRQNVVRQIGAIFDTRRLGYSTSLVAMRFPDEKLDLAAQAINRHPGVSHNYARDGYFNLWFTIATPPYEDMDETLARMAEETGALATRKMPTIRFFKIGVNFDMVKHEGNATSYFTPDSPASSKNGASEGWNQAQPLSDFDIQFIREMQEDLELIPRPFDGMAERLGVTTEGLFAHTDEMMERKLMRRYSAVLHHRRAGFSANAMGVWDVPPERAQEVGEIMAENRWVTHCYERPRFPDWHYSHFTMIHAKDQETCEKVAEDISDATGITDYKLLYSTREYKKTRVRYFVDE